MKESSDSARSYEDRRHMKQVEGISQVSKLWARLDKIRDHSVSKRPLESVVAPLAALLLLRWAEHVDAEEKAVAAFDGHDYQPSLPRHLHWTSWSEFRGTKLIHFVRTDLMTALQAARNGTLGQSLQRLLPVVENLAHASPKTIDPLVQWCQDYDLETPDGRQAAGLALATLVEKATENATKMKGEFTTPRPVVELMVDLLDPSPGDRIYDPCFGSGGLLATVATKLREQALYMPPKVWTDIQQESLFGIEINPHAYCVGLARTVLSGVEQPGLELGDALERPLSRDRTAAGFHRILAVPPWGGRVKRNVAAHFPVSTANIETLFLQHVMASLRPGGRAVIALPDGALFRAGADRKVRQALLSNYRVEGVISLPAGAFEPYTTIKISLVVFRREKAKPDIRFLEIEEWPWVGLDNTFGREKAVAVARGIAEEFRTGAPTGRIWETPIKTLANRDWELVAKRTDEDTLARSLTAVQETDSKILQQPLQMVADIFAGLRYRKNETTPHGDDPSVVAGIVRVADVQSGGLRSPSLFLTTNGSRHISGERRLREGDVLLRNFGAIGRPEVVPDSVGAVGAIAARGLIVVRPAEGMSPQFLKCLLGSNVYQQWLRGHARGATVQRLSVRMLRRLPVLVPELPIQERVVRQMVGGKRDPLATIKRILTETEDPIEEWLAGSSEVQELRRWRRTANPAFLLEQIARSVLAMRNQVAHSNIRRMPRIARWLMDLAEIMETLQGLDYVPPGSGRMAILDSAKLRLKTMRSVLSQSSLPAIESASRATARIYQLVRRELASILDDVRLEPNVEPDAVSAGTENEIQIRLENRSPLALRNVELSTSPDIGSARVWYLANEQEVSFSARVPARAMPGPFPFRLRWRADRLDGRPVSGEAPMAVDVRSTRKAVRLAELGTSPYIVGSPIDQEEMFFGRQDIIDTIRRQLSTSHRANVILLEGNRRTGKTSILKRLEVPGILPGWVTVNCSFQGGEGHECKAGLPTNEVFRLMARDVFMAAHNAGLRVWFPNTEPPDPETRFRVALVKGLSKAFSVPRPFQVFELFLQDVIEAASPRRLLLMLDEFDKLQEGIDTGITSPQVPENIRYLLHTYPGMSAVLSGTRRLKRLREEYWSALFGFGHRIPVSELPEKDARLLVTRPIEGRLSYVPEARDRVVELCSRQPFLIQSLCNRIFERAARLEKRSVTVGDVDTAAEVMVEDNEHFRTLWGYAASELKRFILALCQHLERDPDPVTLSLLEAKLEEFGIVLPRSDPLGRDLEFLCELELLRRQGTTRGSAYMIAIPLMVKWIRRNIDFEDQRQRAVRESEALDDGSGYGYGSGDGRGMSDGSGYGAGDGYASAMPAEDDR